MQAIRISKEDSWDNIRNTYVQPDFAGDEGKIFRLQDLQQRISEGLRTIVTADFGAGKSEALKQLFGNLRQAYFKDPSANRFPMHINLRDCYGLKFAHEIITRHASEIGFADVSNLVSAWRSGSCDLLLDGFDELVPTKWVGGARDLKQVRWTALECVRRLIQETPPEAGIIIAGRAQFFSTSMELLLCMGDSGASVVHIEDLSDEQILNFADGSLLPSWIPRRPLLVRHIIDNDLARSLTDARATDCTAPVSPRR